MEGVHLIIRKKKKFNHWQGEFESSFVSKLFFELNFKSLRLKVKASEPKHEKANSGNIDFECYTETVSSIMLKKNNNRNEILKIDEDHVKMNYIINFTRLLDQPWNTRTLYFCFTLFATTAGRGAAVQQIEDRLDKS